MSDYQKDVETYDANASETVVSNIVKYCGIALRNKDSSLVSSSDKKELDRVRDGFAKKKLELTPEQAEEGIKKVCEEMKGVRQKSRVTFYYLLARATNTMDKLS